MSAKFVRSEIKTLVAAMTQNGYTVKDLNENAAGLTIRGENLVAYDKDGRVVGRAWDYETIGRKIIAHFQEAQRAAERQQNAPA